MATSQNPYNYPVTLIYDKYTQGVQTTEEIKFSDLQQAWCWARDKTGIYTFPEGPQAVGEYSGWWFMSFLYLKNRIAQTPQDEVVIFKRNSGFDWYEFSVQYDE